MRECTPEKLAGIDLQELQYYHRLRNLMYHEGNGIMVEPDRIDAYLQIARLLFRQLFGVELPPAVLPQPTTALGAFLSAWAEFEREVAGNLDEDVDTSRIPELIGKVGLSVPWQEELRRLHAFRVQLAQGDVPSDEVLLEYLSLLEHTFERLGRGPARPMSSLRRISSGDRSARASVRHRTATDAIAAARAALTIAKKEECACRPNSGRHHLLLAILAALVVDASAPWSVILEQAQRSANEFNRRMGLPMDARPAGTVFTTSAMSMKWMRGYLAEGARYGERYSTRGPNVRTSTSMTAKGASLSLA